MTRLTVTIPAKNEERLIGRALDAIARQEMVPVGAFDVIVLANDCSDGTAARVRAFAAAHPALAVDLIETRLPADRAHIGTARRLVMDTAAERFRRRGVDGIIASTDADTVVDGRWIATTLAAMHDVDAVAGRIDILPDDWDALSAALQAAYERDGVYYRAVALVEATLDPLPWDPAPRHADHFGGSFAVKTSAYVRVGGVPVVERLEDVALYRLLLRADVPVRHALDVRVGTSGRLRGRVDGGFATHLDDLVTLHDWHVEDPRVTIRAVLARAALRRWHRRSHERDVSLAARYLDLDPDRLRALLDRAQPFGENWHRVEAAAADRRARYPAVPVDAALARLRLAIASANAKRPTRSNAASGAG